jgi:hypothetical protein
MARRGTVPDRGDIVWLKAWTGRLDARNAKAGHRTRWLQTFPCPAATKLAASSGGNTGTACSHEQ